MYMCDLVHPSAVNKHTIQSNTIGATCWIKQKQVNILSKFS